MTVDKVLHEPQTEPHFISTIYMVTIRIEHFDFYVWNYTIEK